MASQNWLLLDAMRPSKALHVDKHAIMQRVQIHARDLRTLDPNLSYPSTIFGRENAIVLNLEHIKAIITSEQVYLQNSSDEDVIPVVEELQRRLRVGNQARQGDGKDSSSAQDKGDTGAEDESPFEFRALEVALEAICSFLAARTSELEISAYSALDHLTSKINGPNLDRVRKLKIAVTRLTARVQKVNDELEQLLNDDDDMADFYLSRKLPSASSLVSSSCEPNLYHTSPPISRASLVTVCGDEKDVEELEMLLEAYLMQIDSTLNKLTRLREYIDATDDYINIEQDNHRNQLIKLELVISSVSVCISVYSLVAGIFGMNIPYTWNDNHGYMFKYVVVFTGILCAVLLVIIMSYARYKRLFG